MRLSIRYASALALLGFRAPQALEVTPNSLCADLCMDEPNNDPASTHSSTTVISDVVCLDWQLSGINSTSIGRNSINALRARSIVLQVTKILAKMMSTGPCVKSPGKMLNVSMLRASSSVNMKFTIDRCLYSYPDSSTTNASAACGESCNGPTQMALTDGLLQTNATSQYQYCDDLNAAFSKNVGACATCLESVPSSQALINCMEKDYTAKSLVRNLTPIQICMP